MYQRIPVILVGMLFATTSAFADIASEIEEGYPITNVLLNAVSQGQAIDDAVYLAVKAAPDRAEAIYTAAAILLPTLPGWACHASDAPLERRYLYYPAAQLGPQPTIRAVADRFFQKDERLASAPDWRKGEYHVKANIAELEAYLGKGWWYKVDQAQLAAQRGARKDELLKTPIFVSLYKDTKTILVDENLTQIALAKQAGIRELPVVFLYNLVRFYPVSNQEPQPNLSKVADRYWKQGDQLTPVPNWKQGDFHLMASIKDIEQLVKLPEKEKFDPKKWEDLKADVQRNGFKKPVFVSFYRNAQKVLVDERDRVAVAKDLGIQQIPVVCFYTELNRLPCGQSAEPCLRLICEAAVAAGGDPTICSPAPGAGVGTTPGALPPGGSKGGPASPS